MPIIIFPMLTSPNVNSNIIPGICKTMEKHIILYGIDDITDQFRFKKHKGITRNLARRKLNEINLFEDRKTEEELEKELQDKKEIIGAQYEKLDDQQKELIKLRSEINKHKEVQSQYKKDYNDLQNEIKDLENQKEKKDEEIKKKEDEIKKIDEDSRDELQNRRQKIADLERKISDLEKKSSKVDDLKFQNQHRTSQLDAEAEKLRQEKLRQEKEIDKYEARINQQQQDLKDKLERQEKNSQKVIDSQIERARQEERKTDKEYNKLKDLTDKKIDKLERQLEKAKDKAPDLKISTIESKSLSLEPTWVSLPNDAGGGILGIKVAPYMLSSDQTLGRALLHDSVSSKIQVLIRKKVRFIIKFLYNLFSRLWIWRYFFPKHNVTGNPKHDIIFDRTIFSSQKKGSRVFTCLNKIDLDNTMDLFKRAGGVKKLFKLGWTSIVIADDVAKNVTFCPKEQKGICSTIPYSMIYSSISTDAKKIYDDMDDAKKSSGVIFRRKTRLSKYIGEFEMNDILLKTSDYSSLNENYLNENINDIFKKLSQVPTNKLKKVIIDLKKMIEKQDIKSITSTLKFLPKVDINSIEFKLSKSPQFKKIKAFSKKVLKNSIPNISEKSSELISTGIALKALHDKKDPEKVAKNDLKDFVKFTRKRLNKIKKDNENTDEYKESVDTETFLVFTLALAFLYVIAYPLLLLASAAEILTVSFATILNLPNFTIISSIVIILLILVLIVTQKLDSKE